MRGLWQAFDQYKTVHKDCQAISNDMQRIQSLLPQLSPEGRYVSIPADSHPATCVICGEHFSSTRLFTKIAAPISNDTQRIQFLLHEVSPQDRYPFPASFFDLSCTMPCWRSGSNEAETQTRPERHSKDCTERSRFAA